MFCSEGIAIISGLNNDAEVGTALSFSSGAVGTLLWRRSDNYVFALILAGSDLVTVGDGVECRVRAILQVVDESEGPTTKREYELTTVPAGDALRCRVVDYLGRPLEISIEGHIALEDRNAIGVDVQVPLLNIQPDMESRQQICEALVTGVKSVDIVTPLGRGQTLLVAGPQGSGKTQLCLDTIVGQRDTGEEVRCVYAAVGCTSGQLARTLLQLRASGCMGYTTVVAAPKECSLGEQYAAILTACSIAEATRDGGGHALVVYNDVTAMVKVWERITVACANLGVSLESAKNEIEDLKKQGSEFSSHEMSPPDINGKQEDKHSAERDSIEYSSALEKDFEKSQEEDELVEYEGMLVSVAAAQRRRFFSSLIQRSAKLNKRLKGGSLTSLLVTPGVPATGNTLAARKKIESYKHLSAEQKSKLISALETKEKGLVGSRTHSPNELLTEVVEELMSIADGQIVLKGHRDRSTGGVTVDPQLSVSRIGSRALSSATAEMAPKIRFDLAQAEDARKFAITGSNDQTAAAALTRAAVISAALPQRPRTVCPLEEQTVQLIALSKGLLDKIEPDNVADELQRLTNSVRKECPHAMAEISKTRRLTSATEAKITECLQMLIK